MDVYLHNNTWNPHTHDLYSSHWNCIWHEICVIMTKWPLSLSRAIEFFEREEHQNELFFFNFMNNSFHCTLKVKIYCIFKFVAMQSLWEISSSATCGNELCVCLILCGKVWKLMENPKSCFAANENLCLHSYAHTTPQLKTKIFRKLNFHVCMPQKRALWKSLKFNMWADYLMKFTINTKSDLRFGFFYRQRR